MRFGGKVVLVLGGGSGIGAASATAFAAEGARVVAVDTDEVALDRLASTVALVPVLADAADPSSLETVVADVLDRHGHLDVLNANHVWFELGRVGDLSLDGFRRSVDVGLTSFWYATKLVLAPMLEQGSGAIVHTSSVSGLAGDYGLGAYNSVKAGVVNLVRATGIEYARKGIRCNAVCPGPIQTPPLDRLRQRSEATWAEIRAAIPMGRYGTAEEVAAAVLFLASDGASFITGTSLTVDGGLHAHSGMPPIGGHGPDF